VAKLVPYGENQVEVGYMLLPEHWGKGLASEMVAHMILLCREKQLADEIIGIVDPENHASVSVLAKFGFTQYKTGEIDGLAASWYKLMLSD
jgi:[ribosomal protein S5]-alanine N-acetyltransferase